MIYCGVIVLIEMLSIVKGFEIVDVVFKVVDVEMIVNCIICFGKYMLILGGSIDVV